MPIQKQKEPLWKIPYTTNCGSAIRTVRKSIVTDIKHKTDLRPGEPKILEFLAEHEPCEQKVIAAGCNLDSASVTGILGRMEKRELIKRETKTEIAGRCMFQGQNMENK